MLELCYRKMFLMKNFSTFAKSQHTIKNRFSQVGMVAPLGDAMKHSRRFKTAYRFLSCIKSAFIFGCSVSIFQRCYALVICRLICKRLSGVKPLTSLWLATLKLRKQTRLIQQKSSDWFDYLIPCISDTFKNAKSSKINSSAGELTAFSQTPQLNTCWVFDAKSFQENV